MIRRLLALAVALMLPAGCAGDEPAGRGAAPTPATEAPRAVFVVLGGDETADPPGVGSLTRAWEQLVYSAMPPSSVLVDLSDRRPTARAVIREQLPRAQALGPTVASVWLGRADAEDATSVEAFTDQVEQIVIGLQQAGARTVLLLSERDPAGPAGRLPEGAATTETPTDPSVTTAVDGPGRYDGALDAVAGRTGAKVVALGTDRPTQESVAAAVRPFVAP